MKGVLSVNSICVLVPVPVRMRSPAKTASPVASLRIGPPGGPASTNLAPVMRDTCPTEGSAELTIAGRRNRLKTIIPCQREKRFIVCVLDNSVDVTSEAACHDMLVPATADIHVVTPHCESIYNTPARR